MNHRHRLRTTFSKLLVRVGIVCTAAGLLPAVAYAQRNTGVPSEVPKFLQVPHGNVLRFHAFADGTQNYDCRSDASGSTSWVFRQPKAVLLDDAGEPIGIHGRGPFWMSYDGSQLIGAGPVSAPARDAANDVPWLLLRGTPGATDGQFAHVSYIQRLDTHGGVAPAGPCDPDVQPTLAVPYAAVYYFYAPVEAARARSDYWVAGDVVGDSNPAQVYATLCGDSGSPRRAETGS